MLASKQCQWRSTFGQARLLAPITTLNSSSKRAQRAPSKPQAVGENVAVVIVDHGSRKKLSNDMLADFGKLYQTHTGTKIVEIAHMEIAEPTIEQAIGKCVEAGANTIVVAPYFLSRGRHIQEDIPALVTEASQKYPGLKCIIADPIGIDPLMAQLISLRVEGALVQSAAASGQ